MLTIVEGKLFGTNKPMLISGYNNIIEVVGKYPISSIVYCYVNGYTTELKFPLVASELTDNGYKFKGAVILHKKCLDYIRDNPDKEFTFTFKVNNEPIVGKQKFVIDYESALRYVMNIPDMYTMLLKTVNQISTKLEHYVNGTVQNNSFSTTGIAPGMIPYTVNASGDYVWDYPFIKEKEAVKEALSLLQGISEQLVTLNERLHKVEQKLNNHIYQEYDL